MLVDFVTFCCPKDIHRLYAPGELKSRVESHGYAFDNVCVVWQRCGDDFIAFLGGVTGRYTADCPHDVIRSEAHPNILSEFGIPENDPVADSYTHGPKAAHYWRWHVINHLIGLKVSTADYIVFSDCDCRIKSQPSSWVDKGIYILQRHREVLIVAPSDGGHMAERRLPGGVRLTQNISQQVFLCERERLKSIDFNVPWNWEFLAPGGPMQEYYYMLEGRMWRYMHHYGLYRAILPEQWRYWHDQWH